MLAAINHSIACATWQWSVSWKLNITGRVLFDIFYVLSIVTMKLHYGELVHDFCFILYSVYRFTICKSLSNCCSILAVQEQYQWRNSVSSVWVSKDCAVPIISVVHHLWGTPVLQVCHLTFILLGQHFWILLGRCIYPLDEVKCNFYRAL
jgi:hypothetical protein